MIYELWSIAAAAEQSLYAVNVIITSEVDM